MYRSRLIARSFGAPTVVASSSETVPEPRWRSRPDLALRGMCGGRGGLRPKELDFQNSRQKFRGFGDFPLAQWRIGGAVDNPVQDHVGDKWMAGATEARESPNLGLSDRSRSVVAAPAAQK